MELGVAFAILLVCIVVGVPVVYSFGAATIWLVLTLGFDASFVFRCLSFWARSWKKAASAARWSIL